MENTVLSCSLQDTAHDSISHNQKLIDRFFTNIQEGETQKPTKKEPNYWIFNHKTLQSTSSTGSFGIGTGEEILRDIHSAIEYAQDEVIIVTCFWAKSASQELLRASLKALASKCQAERRSVRVNICFSSLSLWQKLRHTPSLHGKTWLPETWPTSFGLPAEEDLLQVGSSGHIGVTLTVKSIFVKPMSVMHPKFVIIDRQRVFLPSCNISWERWFEGCITLRGDVVEHFIRFYQAFWAGINTAANSSASHHTQNAVMPDGHDAASTPSNLIPTLFLPSPHHQNPHFRPTCLLRFPPPPPTPLNTFLLTAMSQAQHSIYIQTPNLTSPPVLKALTSTLTRGIDITIVISPRMMVVEQLLTSGTITELCVRALIRRHKKLTLRHRIHTARAQATEEASPAPGKLSMRYFKPNASKGDANEPVKSHLKLAIIDERIVVLGSGNMDRASWYTSQELGVAFFDAVLAAEVKERVGRGLEGWLGEELLV